MREGIQALISTYVNLEQSNRSIRAFRQTGLLNEWREIVGGYSEGELTYKKDKLLAIFGVARSLKDQFVHEYIAGLRRPELEW